MARSIYVPQAGGLVKFRDEATDADIVAYLKAAYPATPPQPAPQPANDASWYGSAIDSAQGRLQAGLGGVSEAVGLEGLAKYLYDASRANDEEAAKYDWGNTDIWNAPSLWEGAKAAGKSIGQSLPDLAGGMAAAGVGAKVGAAAGTLGGPFAEITVPAGAAIGGIGGALGYYFTSNTGANLQEQVKENGGDLESADEGRAMAGAAVQAPLDVLADKVALKRFFPGVSKEIEKALIGSTITRAAVHGAKSAGVGGVTEALQQAIQIGQANPDKLWSMSPEVQGELIDAAIAGGLFEGIVGGITGGADPAADIGAKRKERELETDIKAEAMAGQEEATNAQVLQAVETLIAKQASGPVQIQFSGTTPDGESATTPKYVVKDAGGNEIVSTTTYPAAVKAISEYKRKTGAKIEVVDDLAASTFKSTPYTVTDKPPAGRAAKWRAEREAAVPFKGGIGDKVVPSTDGVSFTPEFDTPISTPEKTALNEPQVAPIMSKPAMTTSEVDKIFSRENPKNPADPNPPETTPEESAKEDIPSPIVNDMVDENGVPIYTTSFEGQQEGVIAAVPDEAVTNDEISDEPFPAPEPKPVVEKPAPDLTMGEKIIDTPPTRIEITPEERKRQDEQYKAIDTAVKARLNSIGLGSFTGGLNLVPTLPETTSSSAPRGSFTVDKGKPVINLAYGIYDPALTTDQLTKKVVGVLNHEIIHGLRATGFFSPSEWSTLVRAVKTTQYQGKKYTYFDRAKATYAKMADGMSGKEADDYFAEEAVAELYRDWTSDAKAAPKQVRGLMNRILQFFRGVFKGMRAAKYEPVFERTESADKSDLSAVATEAVTKFSAAPDDYIYIIHGGSNFDEINLNKSGTGEPGNIRPLGNGLYGVHVHAGNEEEARAAISLANRYATKYGRGDKTLHVFRVTGDVTHSANGPRSTTLPDYTAPEGRNKAQMRSERLPMGVTEVSINDPSIAQRVGKYPADTHPQEIISDLRRKDMNGPGGARFSMAPQGEPVFYSALQRAVENMKMTKAPAQQWINTIKNQQGVKQEEIDWTGLNDWLSKQDRPVTKQEIVDFIKANQIEVKEITSGTEATPLSEEEGAERSELMRRVNMFEPDLTQHEEQRLVALEGRRNGEYRHTAYSQYQLPGGDNYRELIFTLPNKTGAPYKSSHWGEPNVMMHIRFNERDIDGKHTLFIEEIQSDWHQVGRKKGYRPQNAPLNRTEANMRLAKLLKNDDYLGFTGPTGAINAIVRHRDDFAQRWEMSPETETAARDYIAAIESNSASDGSGVVRVPDAPFKTTWPEMAMRRMVRWAADNGFDKIAWTPGDVQNSRYSLSKQIDSIGYTLEDGRYWVTASKNGAPVAGIDNKPMTADELEDTLGKEIAEKIVNGEGVRYGTYDPPEMEITGADLEIGGKGMRGFYDKMLVDIGNKLGKKAGVKVAAETMDVPAGEAEYDPEDGWAPSSDQGSARKQQVWSMDVTPSLAAEAKKGYPRFSLAPGMEEAALPDVISKGNEKLFAPFQAEKPLGQRIKSFFTGGDEYKNATAALFGGASVGRVPMAIRVAMVDSHAQLLELEKKANKAKAIKGATGEEERLNADYSVYASFNFAERAGHFTAYAAHKGNIEVVMPDGTIDSAYAKVAESEDNISNIIGILTPERDGKRVSLFDAFRSYAVAKRGQTLAEIDGKLVPVQLDAAYRNTALKEIPRLYPEVVQAYDMYQRMNGRILEAAEKSGLISKETRSNWADKMNYYAFYREMEDDFFAQPVTAAPGSKIDIKKYKGSKLGNLASDPITVMLHNMHFWNSSIMKNIASRKAFNLMEAMGEARPLSGTQSPSFEAGEVPQTFHYRVNGVDKRYAVKDHLLATSLRFNERMDFGIFSKILGLPTHWLRESVTRDPRFMITNLMRDTLASWVVRGENTIPIVDSVRGFKKALSKDNVSMRALMAFGVSGQYDKSMMTAEEMSKTLKLEHENMSEILQARHLGAGMKMIWRTFGKWSDASDAASRIPIYENVLKETGNEAEAAFRALEVLNFSRRGSSRALSLFTQAIPFLNARIQGFDVMYQGGKSAYRYATGKGSAMDARIGRAFLVRGMMLAGIAMALEALYNEIDDEDYKNLPDYIKDSNILLKVPGTSKFVSWPKPFEVGLLFMTIPQHAVRIGMGNASTADATKMFTSQVASTFAVNPIPQFAAPVFENFYNHDFFTGQPVVSEGKERLEPFMQYDSRTSAISRMLGEMINWSPAKIENLITGWGGPMGSYLLYVGSTLLNGTLNEMGSGVQTLPTDVSNWPMVRAIMVDAETKNPQVVTTAYEMYRDVDTVNRTLSRLKKSGDVEAVRAYVEDNRGILKAKAPVMKIAEALNNIAAQERRIERNTTMTREQKLEAMRKLREMKLRVTQNVPKIREMMDQ